MADFIRGDCHKCKYEITAECVPRSQKMGFPNCYQSTITNADRIRAMTDEELAEWLEAHCYQYGWLEWLKQEASI